ncbi:MAG: methylated-DNA-[protein]-cysteine S-methyltransferase [Candidatus Promineifilaceae bacterium]|jgi:methylated-DNA-[protein]-cysteine S-methyltransferase
MRPLRTTAFQQRVYDALSRVPKGRVTTYKVLSESIGCGSSQAVGQALKRNPFAPTVPCHRVISSTLRLGGYLGCTEGDAVHAKRRLLAEEGVTFDDNHLVDKSRVLYRVCN